MSNGIESLDTQSYRAYSQIQVALLSAALYDYVGILPAEIDLVWTRSWTISSGTYLLCRYLGLIYLTVPVVVLAIKKYDAPEDLNDLIKESSRRFGYLSPIFIAFSPTQRLRIISSTSSNQLFTSLKYR